LKLRDYEYIITLGTKTHFELEILLNSLSHNIKSYQDLGINQGVKADNCEAKGLYYLMLYTHQYADQEQLCH
jgi:hypothetical protein